MAIAARSLNISRGARTTSRTSHLLAPPVVSGTRLSQTRQLLRPVPCRVSRSRRAVQVEANIFSRIVRVIRSYITGAVESFEDPEVMLDRITAEMQEDAARMRQALARVKASEVQLATKQHGAQGLADQWLRRAELALEKGDEELAREALRRRQGQQAAADGLCQQLAAQRKAADQLGGNVRMLEGKIQEAFSKCETLKARTASAKASREVQELLGGLRISASSSTAAFERMEEKVLAMESEAEAVGILATPDNLESRFQQLEGSGGLEDELVALKRGLAAGGRRGRQEALPPGRPISEVLGGSASGGSSRAVDLELEALRRRVYDGRQ